MQIGISQCVHFLKRKRETAENHGGYSDRARNVKRRDDSAWQREKDGVRRSEKRGELRVGQEGEKQKNDLTIAQEQN